MSTHKHFDKICGVVLAVTLIITVLFINGEKLGIQKASTVMGYENTLFDNSRVHTLDIIMDDWDEFTANARSEEYYVCSVVIDGEAYKNVAIRGKGNTSLSSVTNDRYSYKIEFDHYDGTNTYHGLDKLVLNNVIQDNTYMKDYLTYSMMNDMGVASPLCSYVYVTVNGEDWGLYLAAEGIEESFLQRNYGKDYGELYKPDSMSMGGGRGNGDNFDMNDFMLNPDTADKSSQNKNDGSVSESATKESEEETTGEAEQTTEADGENIPEEQTSEEMTQPDFSGGNPFGGEMPDGMTPPDFSGGNPFGGEMPDGMTPPDFSGGNPFGGEIPDGMTPPDFSGGSPFGGQMPGGSAPSVNSMSKTSDDGSVNSLSQGGMPGGMTPPDFNGESPFGGEMPDFSQLPEGFADIFGGGNGGFGGMSSVDVKLQYIDDDPDSYSNIFNNAKTDVTNADKTRLIQALKKLSSSEEAESVVDAEAVIRYFAVHNFVVNSDSYTGTMIHNYYLYEKDGKLQMIPWDYNLAFGSFMSTGSATGSVNDPIDTPLSVSGSGDRPMIDWIFGSEEYTELYHQILGELIEKYFDSGYFEEMTDSVKSMIAPYVEKDPTKFCTYEEFETGIATLKEFCLLRAESVKGQLNGTIGTTSATQEAQSLVDASHIDTSDMGSMGMAGGNGMLQMPDKINGNTGSLKGNGESGEPKGYPSGQPQIPDIGFADMMPSQYQPQGMASRASLVMLVFSVLILCTGIVFAFKFRRGKKTSR